MVSDCAGYDRLSLLQQAKCLEDGALDAEKDGQFQKAFSLYKGALDLLRVVYTRDTNARIKTMVRERIEELLNRAEPLRTRPDDAKESLADDSIATSGLSHASHCAATIPAVSSDADHCSPMPSRETHDAPLLKGAGTVNDGDLALLVDMGFDIADATRAMEASGSAGVDKALELLLTGAVEDHSSASQQRSSGSTSFPAPASTDTYWQIDPESIMDSANEVSKQAFQKAIASLVLVAGNGYPRALRSSMAIRNELLRRHRGDVEAAAREIIDASPSFAAEARHYLMVLVPEIGIPAMIVIALWSQLRTACLVAALFGHDLNDPDVQARILYAAAGSKVGASLAKAGLVKATEFLWAKVVARAGLGNMAKMVPATAIVLALADIQDRGDQGMIEDFREGRRYLLESHYRPVLDAEPSLLDFMDLIREIRGQSLTQAIAKGTELSQTAEVQAQAFATSAEQHATTLKESAEVQAQSFAASAEQHATTLKDAGRRSCDDFSLWTNGILQQARSLSLSSIS